MQCRRGIETLKERTGQGSMIAYQKSGRYSILHTTVTVDTVYRSHGIQNIRVQKEMKEVMAGGL